MNTFIFRFLLCFSLITIFISCKKTPPEPPKPQVEEANPLLGVWKIETSSFAYLEYIEFENDSILQMFFNEPDGFYKNYFSKYTKTRDSIFFSGTRCSYKIQSNKLILNQYGFEIMNSTLSQDKPSRDWFMPITELETKHNLLNLNYDDLSYDGTFLLACDYQNDNMLKINLTTNAVKNVFMNGSKPNSIEFADDYLYAGRKGSYSLFQHNLSGGTALNTYKGMGQNIEGIAFQTGSPYLWCYSDNDTLYQFQKNTENIVSQKFLGEGFNDLCWHKGKIYLSYQDKIYEFDVNQFKVLKTYKLKYPAFIYGIASTGTDIWLNTSGNKLIRINLD